MESLTPRSGAHRSALNIALTYLTVSLLWVALSDAVLTRLIGDAQVRAMVQTYKGWLFVTATAGLLYALVRLHLGRLLSAERRRRESEAALHRAREQSRRREAELAHASRLVLVGELASGLAHELTQPLGAILHYSETLRERASKTVAEPDDSRGPSSGPGGAPDTDEALEAVVTQARRAEAIILRLRAFARKQAPQPAVLDMNRLIRDSLGLLSPAAQRRGVAFELELDADLPAVRADALQVQQVLVNLGGNAIEAASQRPAGQRRVVWCTRRDEGRVRVLVRDSGPGPAPGVGERLFESFFTTREAGLGLGLPISRSIVEAHGGRLTHRRDGGWTEFGFHLPVPLDFQPP